MTSFGESAFPILPLLPCSFRLSLLVTGLSSEQESDSQQMEFS